MDPPASVFGHKDVTAQPEKRPIRTKEVLIKIGQDLKPYRFSRDAITKHSDFFRSMFSNNWTEDQDQTVSLPYVDVGMWEVFLEWVETDWQPRSKWEALEAMSYPRLRFPHAGPLDDDSYEVRETVEKYYILMIELGSFFVADELVRELHNWFVDRSIQEQRRATYGAVIFAFEHLPDGHSFLRFLVEAQRHYHDPLADKEEEEVPLQQQLPADFLKGLSSKLTVAITGIDDLNIYFTNPPLLPLLPSDFHI